MSCGGCGKKLTKFLAEKPFHIIKGFTALAAGKEYEFTKDRISECEKCEKKVMVGSMLFCSICKCFIPAKARVKEEKCPLGKW